MRTKRNAGKKRTSVQLAPTAPNRCDMLKLMRNVAIGITVLGGFGYWAAGSFTAYAAEHDLSRVGHGAATIVQIHDPQCPVCTSLQNETRAALNAFDDCGMLYLVADIKTAEGAAFAARYSVPHITLLFFDGDGERLHTVNGMHTHVQLEDMFARFKEITQA